MYQLFFFLFAQRILVQQYAIDQHRWNQKETVKLNPFLIRTEYNSISSKMILVLISVLSHFVLLWIQIAVFLLYSCPLLTILNTLDHWLACPRIDLADFGQTRSLRSVQKMHWRLVTSSIFEFHSVSTVSIGCVFLFSSSNLYHYFSWTRRPPSCVLSDLLLQVCCFTLKLRTTVIAYAFLF